MSVPAGRCHSSSGPVVRIGAVRVRLSPVHVAQPSGGGATDSDCCCGVPWPSRSRIPLPATTTYSRGIFSRGAAPPDTRKLIVNEDADSGGTLDRLLKTRFGGGDRTGRGKRAAPHKKKPRTTDKTERLRELTEKLKSPPAGRGEPGPSSSAAAQGPPPAVTPSPAPAPPEDDLFECVDLKLPKPESRTIVGSYIQRTIPFRSASFSQVDFSPADGKYIRSGRGQGSKIPSLSACLTLPRKKTPDTSPSSSRATSTTVIDVPDGSNLSLVSPSVKPPNVRSLTHPLSKRDVPSEEVVPVVDGSISRTPVVAESPLEELKEESEADRECVVSNSDTIDSQPVVQTFVTKWPSESPTTGDTPQLVPSEVSRKEENKYFEHLPNEAAKEECFKVDNLQQTSNVEEREQLPNEVTCPKEQIATEEHNKQSPNEVSCDRSAVERDKISTLVSVEDVSKRWSGDGTSGEWQLNTPEEPQSPEEGVKPSWPRRWLERPRLVCQSSEEREDDGGSPRRQLLARTDSLSEGESENGGRPTTPSVLGESDSEGRVCSPHPARRYSKRPLRGPYGQMLEAEMKKPEANRKFSKLDELKFLETLPQPQSTAADDCHLKRSYTSPGTPLVTRSSPKRKVSANIPYSAPNPPTSAPDPLPVVHIRTTSSPSQLEGCARAAKQTGPRPPLQPSPQLLAHLLKGSSERNFAAPGDGYNFPLHCWKDTRTHVVVELYETERSYVESLETLVMKYLEPLKSPENAGLVDAALVEEIFYQVPAILAHHEEFLRQLKTRLEHWDVRQRVGDIFLDTFTKQPVVDTYTAFINNWKTAKEAIKATSQAKPAFARFLEAMAREHKGKLALDSLLIMPVQRIPRYELLIQTLLKHTEPTHPDHSALCEAQHSLHMLAVRINCTERDSLELEQLEGLIEGAAPLVAPDRSLLHYDLVTLAPSSQGRKERALFLFTDLLLVTSIKRRSGTIRKPSVNCPGTIASTLEGNKYKLLMKISLDDLEIVKEKDESVRRLMREMENLRDDVSALTQMTDLVAGLHCPHSQLETDIRDMHSALAKQLSERQNSETQLSFLDLLLNTQNGVENLSVIFSKSDKRNSWEEALSEAKQRLAMSADKRLCPEFVAPVAIRKTRAGLQFTCAAPTLGAPRDVWVCNSDGYVGQVCVLSLNPEPTVTSCNGVCNARILCIAAVPAYQPSSSDRGMFTVGSSISISVEDTEKSNSQLDSSQSSSSEDEGVSVGVGEVGGAEDCDHLQPTMWLGTEDGCIHVYNSSDNIRIKKNRIKIQHGSSVHSIIYLDNRVFVSLENGDISVYARDSSGVWDSWQPCTVSVGTVASPVTRMVPVSQTLWCCCHNMVKILNTSTLHIEHQFSGSGDTHRSISCLVAAGLGIWLALQNSAVLRLFHSATYECLTEVNVAPSVTKMLASCDDIIRQHKAACLRVTALLACEDLLWVGTSAGVVLTLPLPHITPSTSKVLQALQVTGLPHGHTGHVRFLTAMESQESRTLVISGGDGYEDFRSASLSEVAGRDDSTNHLLLWQT